MIGMEMVTGSMIGLAQSVYVVEVTEIGDFISLAGGDPVPAAGLVRALEWEGVSGATRIVFDEPGSRTTSEPPSGWVGITPYPTIEEIKNLSFTDDGSHIAITNPEKRPLRRLTLHGLKKVGEDEPVFTSRADLETRPAENGKWLRLLVSVRGSASEEWIPTFAMPPLPRRGMLPAMLAGASFNNKVLILPYTISGQVRLSLVENDVIGDLNPVNTELSGLDAQAEYVPRDLELLGPEGQVLWGMPGPFLITSPPAEVDVRVHLEAALQRRLEQQQPIEATLTLKSAEKSTVRFVFTRPTGALLREHPGVLRVVLAGESVPMDLGAPLATAAPDSAGAGIFIRYDGLRLLPSFTDPVPSEDEPVSGRVVTSAPVLQRLPPTALDGQDVARVGLVGRAPEVCELEVQIIHQHGTVPGEPMGPAGILEVAPSNDVRVAWVELPPRTKQVGQAAIRVHARKGRFYWVGAEQPHVRIAVRDSAPEPHPIYLNDVVLTTVGSAGAELTEYLLPPAAFTGAMPVLHSDLFLTVDVTGLTLRYAR